MNAPRCRIATRRSPLAVRQAEWVADELARHHGLRPELVRLQTQGDKMLEHPLAAIGGKGLFIKELESSLLCGDTDLAVHSMKDVPAKLPEGLEIAAVCARADPRDAVIAREKQTLEMLAPGSRIGTSSLRRRAQLQARFPHLQFEDLRGNVGTRLQRLDAGDFDAIILACAGLQRLGLEKRITQLLEPEDCLPAIGQGALGIEIATAHPKVRDWLRVLHEPRTATAVQAERAVSRALSASCQIPLAAHATCDHPDEVRLRACLARPDGRLLLHAEAQGDPEAAGAEAATSLLDQGGGAILKELGVAGFA